MTQGYLSLLDEVYRTGKPYAAYGAKYVVQAASENPVDERYLDFVYQPINEGNGSVSGILVAGVEVTARFIADQALASSRARLDYATRLSGVGFWYCDLPFDELKWDERVKDHFFFPPSARITIDDFYARIHEKDRAPTREAIDRSIHDRTPYDIVYRTVHPTSGAIKWIRALGGTDYANDGTPIYFDGVTVDVSEQKLDQERLSAFNQQLTELNETLEVRVEERAKAAKQAEARFRGIFNSTYQFTSLLHLDGTIVEVNRAALDALGPTPIDTVGSLLWEAPWFSGTPEAVAVLKGAMPAAAGGQSMRTDLHLLLPDNRARIYNFSLTPVYNDEDRVEFIVAEGYDVTDAKQLEEALRQSQKMEAVGQLTGGIAHDFNYMLAVVIGSLDLLGRRIGPADARASRYVEAAKDGSRRAATLTQRLLAFSRQQPLKPELLDANKLVAGMSELIRGSLGSDVRLETVLSAGVWRIHADQNQLENAILNLAVNARDAMPEGGRLTIETQNAHFDTRYVSAHPGVAAGQYVLIAVTDTGAGMPPETIAKAFDPFFTTKEVGKGTGLGLSQVYGFVKQSGGHVKIYSEPGHGTTVKLYLPRLIGDDGTVERSEAERDIPMGELQEVVLVVEDEPAVRQFSVDALGELGYRVLEADGAVAALELLNAHPEIALMFTDIIMPDVNGAKLAMEARRHRSDLKVLFTTGYTRNAVVHNGVLDSDVQLIGKPFTIEELAAKIREVLDEPAKKPVR